MNLTKSQRNWWCNSIMKKTVCRLWQSVSCKTHHQNDNGAHRKTEKMSVIQWSTQVIRIDNFINFEFYRWNSEILKRKTIQVQTTEFNNNKIFNYKQWFQINNHFKESKTNVIQIGYVSYEQTPTEAYVFDVHHLKDLNFSIPNKFN